MSTTIQDSIIPSREIKTAAFDDAALDALVIAYGVDEVLIGFRSLAADLKEQLRIGGDDRDWKRRAGRLSSRVDARISVLRAEVRERNRQETATVDAAMAKWGGFAQMLAEQLEAIDPHILATLPGPGDDLTSAEWLAHRRTQQARKRARAEYFAGGAES